ncbi:NAD(P)-dependent oxidoreductase [Myxococcus sp. MISCRS1]|uniref:NAD(P)-dependent oxidoreductase n=1 Tax=unclassified Myxococcus TaxID=2648731 RepID=UPI001CBAF7BD|nr:MULTISPECIES: NAD(P)-dependent oxidoreductase [unclassified Myxococcus]MBZ4412719.1 NAD(P)-dependent oxidoreductase [Myxococcus sp. XM-1-1-1]MCY1000045.1 NAD(P)-dependent oxidoreductase [Myxococcus sp. MISCRS1]
MSSPTQKPVLIIGGSGVVGSMAAQTLRRFHPELPITIGGRDVARAEAVAQKLGHADAVRVDLSRGDLGLPEGRGYSAVVLFVKDHTLNALRFAQARGIPHLGISTALFEVAPEVAYFMNAPQRSAVLLGTSWLVGAATLPALHFAREFKTLDSIAMGAVLDEQDVGGPAASADLERAASAAPNALILEDGKWRWVGGPAGERRFRDGDGNEHVGQAYSLTDPVSLAAETKARAIRLDAVVGLSAGRRKGGACSVETLFELEGTLQDGTRALVRYEMSHAQGQAPVTAVGVAVSVERLLGLAGGAPVAPGLYLPNVLIEPAYLMRRLEEAGVRTRRLS